jgi:hypothetical protein
VLIEARPLDGGVELIYQAGADRASVLLRGRQIEFPHVGCSAGESLGSAARDEVVRAEARSDAALLEAAAIWSAARVGR